MTKVYSNIDMVIANENDFQFIKKFSNNLKKENINLTINKAKLKKVFEDSSQLMLLAKNNSGEIIGLISATKKNELHDNTRWLELFVNTESRDKGIGTKLLRSLILECKQIDRIDNLYLSVMKNNSQAIHLYKTNGFMCKNKLLHFFTSWTSLQLTI